MVSPPFYYPRKYSFWFLTTVFWEKETWRTVGQNNQEFKETSVSNVCVRRNAWFKIVCKTKLKHFQFQSHLWLWGLLLHKIGLNMLNKIKTNHINDNHTKSEISLHFGGIWPTVWGPTPKLNTSHCKFLNARFEYDNIVIFIYNSIRVHLVSDDFAFWSKG